MKLNHPLLFRLSVFALKISAIILIFGMALWPMDLLAAHMEALPMDNGQGSIIIIAGDLEAGDEKKFIDLALANPESMVLLGSNGGNLLAGIEIGKAIRLKGYSTLVPDGALCASACALAWLGGRPRSMGEGAKVGFHAASFKENGEVTSAGNALIGAYLNQLGLPTKAVIYISEPAPGEIRWLTFSDAQEHGIDVTKFNPPKLADNPAPVQPPSNDPPAAVAPIQPASVSIEEKTKTFITNYFQKLSLDTATAMTSIANAYAPTVIYYHKSVTSNVIQKEKLAFFNRWPTHGYMVEPSNLNATCAGLECQVSGNVSWKMYSAERSTHSEGISSFSFYVNWSRDRPLITLEDTKVLSREKSRDQSAGPVQAGLSTLNMFPRTLTGTILPPYCHMDYCSWMSIENRESVAPSRDGELFRLSVRDWSSSHPGGSYNVKTRRTGGMIREEYVFCSQTRPSVAFSL